jgi:hypothetical protein
MASEDEPRAEHGQANDEAQDATTRRGGSEPPCESIKCCRPHRLLHRVVVVSPGASLTACLHPAGEQCGEQFALARTPCAMRHSRVMRRFAGEEDRRFRAAGGERTIHRSQAGRRTARFRGRRKGSGGSRAPRSDPPRPPVPPGGGTGRRARVMPAIWPTCGNDLAADGRPQVNSVRAGPADRSDHTRDLAVAPPALTRVGDAAK